MPEVIDESESLLHEQAVGDNGRVTASPQEFGDYGSIDPREVLVDPSWQMGAAFRSGTRCRYSGENMGLVRDVPECECVKYRGHPFLVDSGRLCHKGHTAGAK